jgi:tetratricopeptide (TPR) repeat protein
MKPPALHVFNGWRAPPAILLVSASVVWSVMTAPAWGQNLKQWKCTGRPDIAWDEQVAGCTSAIKSGKLAGKDLALAFLNRGIAYRRATLSTPLMTMAIKLNPGDAESFFNRGVANGMRGKLDTAIEDFDQAIKLKPDHVGALYSRGLTYSNKWERAIQDYDQAIKLSPDNVMAVTNRGNAYLALKQYDRAIADYDQAIELDPSEAIPFNNRGSAYYQIGQVDRAMAD